MTVEALAVALAALFLLLSTFAFAFMLGAWALAQVYHAFSARHEERTQRRISLAVQKAVHNWSEAKSRAERTQRQWGPDLSARHQPTPSEEIERVLSSGPGD